MRQYLFCLIILITTLGVNAQQSRVGSDKARVKMVEIKTRYMISTLNITSEQQSRFIEIYRRFNKNMRGAWSNSGRNEKASDAKTEAERIKQNLANQKRAIEVQMATIDELAQVLNAEQLSRFLDTERKIQTRIKTRREQAMQHQGDRARERKKDDN